MSLTIQGDGLDRPPRSRCLVLNVLCTEDFEIQAIYCIELREDYNAGFKVPLFFNILTSDVA